MKLLLLLFVLFAATAPAHQECEQPTSTAMGPHTTRVVAPTAPFSIPTDLDSLVTASVDIVIRQRTTRAYWVLFAMATMAGGIVAAAGVCRRTRKASLRRRARVAPLRHTHASLFPAVSDHAALYIPDAFFMNASFVLASMSRGHTHFAGKSFPSEEGMGRLFMHTMVQHPEWNKVDWQCSLFECHLRQGRICVLVEAEDPEYYKGFLSGDLQVHTATSGLAKAVMLVPEPWTMVAHCDGKGVVCGCEGRPYLWVVVKHTVTNETRFVMGAHFPNTNCGPDKATGFCDATQMTKIREWFASTVQMHREANGTISVQIAGQRFSVDDCILGSDTNDDQCQQGAITGALRTNAVDTFGSVLGTALVQQPPLVTGCALAKNGQFHYCGSWLCSVKTPVIPQYATCLPPPIYEGEDHYRFGKDETIRFDEPDTFLSKVKPAYKAATLEKAFAAYAPDCGWTDDIVDALATSGALVLKTN